MRSVLRADTDVNTFEQTLGAFTRFAANFHSTEGRYYFDTEDQPEAKVEFRALKVEDPDARDFLRQLFLQEIFRETNAVFFDETVATQEALNALAKDRVRFVLAPARLKPEDRHALFHGPEFRNQVLLLEPRDRESDLDRNADLLHWAKRQIAVDALLPSTEQSDLRETYERIKRGDRKYCVEAIRRAGLVYIHWQHYGAPGEEDSVEEEEIPSRDLSAREVMQAIHDRLFPVQVVVEHLSSRLFSLLGKNVRAIERDYKATLTYPVPLFNSVLKAVRQLARDGVLSVQHPRGNYSHEDPDLSDTELLDATVGAPFEKAPAPQPPLGRPPAGARPPVPGAAPVTTTAPATPAEQPPPASLITEEVSCPPKLSPGELRQEIALRLAAHADAAVEEAVFQIFLDEETGDLSSYPAGLRGGLTGPGTLEVEIKIRRPGPLTKAQVEQLAESLPNIPQAHYQATMKVAVRKETGRG